MWRGECGGGGRDGTLHAYLLIHLSIFFGYLFHWFKEWCYRCSWISMNSMLSNSVRANSGTISHLPLTSNGRKSIYTHEIHNRRYSVADIESGCSCTVRTPSNDRKANRSWRRQQKQQKEDHKCFKIDSKGEFSHMNEPGRWFTTSSTNQTQFFFFLFLLVYRSR